MDWSPSGGQEEVWQWEEVQVEWGVSDVRVVRIVLAMT